MHGRNVVDAVRRAAVQHLVFVSVAGATKQTDVPLFESKRRVEEHLRASGVTFTVIAPVYLMENLWNPWNMALLESGRFPSPIPPQRRLQQIALENVVELAAFAIDHREDLSASGSRSPVTNSRPLTRRPSSRVWSVGMWKLRRAVDRRRLSPARSSWILDRYRGAAAALPGDRLARLQEMGAAAGLVDARLSQTLRWLDAARTRHRP